VFTCRRWELLRTDMREAHGSRYGDISYALGGYNNVLLDGQRSKWKPDLQAVRVTIDFVLATKRLDYVPFGDAQLNQT